MVIDNLVAVEEPRKRKAMLATKVLEVTDHQKNQTIKTNNEKTFPANSVNNV